MKKYKNKNYIHLFDNFYCTIDNLNCTVFRQIESRTGEKTMSAPLGYPNLDRLGSFLSRWATEDEFGKIQDVVELIDYIKSYSEKMDEILFELIGRNKNE